MDKKETQPYVKSRIYCKCNCNHNRLIKKITVRPDVAITEKEGKGEGRKLLQEKSQQK